jgi:Inosine-uridine nucleoside N-ribohydrolase
MYLLHPEFFKMEKAILDVDCSDGAGRGAMLCDFRWWLHDEEKIKDMILTDTDTESFQQELFEAIYSVTGQKA